MVALVPVDFSDTAQVVISKAVEFARKMGPDLCLLHVTTPTIDRMGMGNDDFSATGIPGSGYGSYLRYDVVRDQIAAELKSEHRELLDLKNSIPDDVKARAILIQGDVVEGILREADELSAELIIMGSHGHGAIHNVILGSISESVIRAGRHPVLVIPSKSG